MIMNEIAFIGLGSNIGDRESNIFSAIAALDVRNEINVKKTASIYETEPLYNNKQPPLILHLLYHQEFICCSFGSPLAP